MIVEIKRIELTENNIKNKIENFIESEQKKYETQHGVTCNYKQFCFVAKIDNTIIGVITGATFFLRFILMSWL